MQFYNLVYVTAYLNLVIRIKPVRSPETNHTLSLPQMDEMQTANAKSSEAVSATKSEIGAARKELQALGLELQGLLTQVSF